MHYQPASNPFIHRPNINQTTHINYTQLIPPPLPPSYNYIVIENTNSKQMTTLFLTDLLSHLNLPSNAISTYKFINNIVIIFFNSDNFYYTFTSKIQNIKKHPHFTNLYFRKQRSLLERERCKLLYHATKANLASSNYKCTYNETYELRNIVNSKVDWESSPINITPQTYKTWENSINTLNLSRINLVILAHLHRQHDFTLSESNPTPVSLLPSKYQCPHLPQNAITA